MALPPDFESESLYAPEAWFVHDIEAIDPATSTVVGIIDSTRLGMLVDAQRVRPGHDKHVPGAIMVQVTATLGQLHATYVLNRRASEGWVGFGTHVKKARFPKMGRIGPPVRASIRATRVRAVRGVVFADYVFEFTQDGAVIYESEQTAAWFRPGDPTST